MSHIRHAFVTLSLSEHMITAHKGNSDLGCVGDHSERFEP